MTTQQSTPRAVTPRRLTLKAKMYTYFPPPYRGGWLVMAPVAKVYTRFAIANFLLEKFQNK